MPAMVSECKHGDLRSGTEPDGQNGRPDTARNMQQAARHLICAGDEATASLRAPKRAAKQRYLATVGVPGKA
jgi:hypothetical protein